MKEIADYNDSFRVLALTASPGNAQRDIQLVITNLKISRIEIRAEDDEDVASYTNMKQVEIVRYKAGREASGSSIKQQLVEFMRQSCEFLFLQKVLVSNNVDTMTVQIVDEAKRYLFEKLSN